MAELQGQIGAEQLGGYEFTDLGSRVGVWIDAGKTVCRGVVTVHPPIDHELITRQVAQSGARVTVEAFDVNNPDGKTNTVVAVTSETDGIARFDEVYTERNVVAGKAAIGSLLSNPGEALFGRSFGRP